MKITLLTNEYPPYIYGGAGVHVEYLSRELLRLDGGAHEVNVFSFGDQAESSGKLRVQGVEAGFTLPAQDPRHAKFMDTVQRNLVMAGLVGEADIVHCHTWYTHLAGCLVKQLSGAKLVLTTHSLEPHRPWKVEQLGSAYHASSWVERTAYQNADGVVAVSEAMRRDVHELYGVADHKIEVIPNGIDLAHYRPTPDEGTLKRYGVDPAIPAILFVGRITRQKGILHLVNALKYLPPGLQVVLCAGAPDTAEIEQEMAARVEAARAESKNSIVWIAKMVPKDDLIALYSHASLFVCPSVYEPFGIINLEAMACETPVVAAAVGGIPEVVVDGETGVLVPLETKGEVDFEPADPERFARALAAAIAELMGDEARRGAMGRAARERALAKFSWTAVAERTVAFYKRLLELPSS
ncbi:MAG: glycogen synthase [Deinococcota bacterium]|jgi:glycogen synthase|nr:glycogen synthase [Deinococcota bacterium]